MKYFLSLLCVVLSILLLSTVAWASPVTGDNGIGTWVVLMVVAVIVLTGVIVLITRRNK